MSDDNSDLNFTLTSSSKVTNSTSSRPSSNSGTTRGRKPTRVPKPPGSTGKSATGTRASSTPSVRRGYVDKRDKPIPVKGRGSSGVTAANPMKPCFDDDQTYCTNEFGEIIKFRITPLAGPDDLKPQRWMAAGDKYGACSRPTEEEWEVHLKKGRNIWLNRQALNFQKDCKTLVSRRTPSMSSSQTGKRSDQREDSSIRSDSEDIYGGPTDSPSSKKSRSI